MGCSIQGHQYLPVELLIKNLSSRLRGSDREKDRKSAGQKISQQLRHSQRRSLRDYNLQVEKMHRILAELKSSADNPVAHGLGNAAGHKSTPFQKLLVKIRSIF
ncbi:hypothetical protein DdX_14786 [Ditylenchus destructor]|uniref:Uncharacterized protein n=1 Tax=Ditylenchus destructor TaxID=166010 RepID=A0AAD4MRJ6_9BILA|nr:hypothetical protein DdX_14786 [Ditylenchus destructor]